MERNSCLQNKWLDNGAQLIWRCLQDSPHTILSYMSILLIHLIVDFSRENFYEAIAICQDFTLEMFTKNISLYFLDSFLPS